MSKRYLALAAVSSMMVACTTVETYSFWSPEDSVVQSVQIATDADFSKYHQLHSGGFGIYFPPNAAIPAEDLQRLRQIFIDAFAKELAGYTVVTEPGPGTMTVVSSLIDLRDTGGAFVPGLRGDISDIAKSGDLVFLMEMKDSETGRVLARAADAAKTPTLATGTGDSTDWQSVDDAAQHWASLFRRFVDENLAQ